MSLESDDKNTPGDVLRAASKSEAAKEFNGKQVYVHAVGAQERKLLWVRSEEVEGGLIAKPTYDALCSKLDAAHKTGEFELRQLTKRQRFTRYGKLEIAVAVLAVIAALVVALKPSADRAAGRRDALSQVHAVAAPLASALHNGNLVRAQAADKRLVMITAPSSNVLTEPEVDVVVDVAAIVVPLLIAALGVWAAIRRVSRPPWQ